MAGSSQKLHVQVDRDSLIVLIPAAPPSTNRLWRIERGRPRISKEAADFYRLVQLCTMGFRPPRGWEYFRVEILVEPTRRSGDVDNKIKAVLDGFTKAGFWRDDSAVAFVSCQFGAINKEGRTIVRISAADRKFLPAFPRGFGGSQSTKKAARRRKP